MRIILACAALCLAAACSTQPTAPTNIVSLTANYQGPQLVTDVSASPIAGTVIYDEVIPFTLRYTDAGGMQQISTTGALQSRVITSGQTGKLVFAYRFRDLVFQPGAPLQNGSQFIEIVRLFGFDEADLPMAHFDIAPSQSLGGEVWGAPFLKVGQGASGQGVEFEWNAFFTKADGTTFTAFSTDATQYQTGAFMSVGDQALGSALLDKIAVPKP